MILSTQQAASGLNGAGHSSDAPKRAETSCSSLQPAVDLVAEVAARYRISALSGLLATARAALGQEEIAVAVLGRFKAGKSSFLNDLIGRSILPVGVIPVTATVTEVRYGPRERAIVHFLDGSSREVPLNQIGVYISERENPENSRQVAGIAVELPELRKFAGLKFVDTPGLESALAHNTRTAIDWLPNVGLALLAVSVDPPLSQRDIELLKSLYQYTPKVGVLLTKADLLNERELAEIVEFVRSQLAKNLPTPPRVFPYSTRPGFERFRDQLETGLILETLGNFAEERRSMVARKVETLLRESAGYLTLSLKSAERVQAEREELKQQVVGEKEILEEAKAQIRLLIQNAAAATRPMVSRQLEAQQKALERALLEEFATEFSNWTASLATMLAAFEQWLAEALRGQLTALSIRERARFLAPLHKVQKQAFRTLQQFRDRLSEGAMQAFGIPLRTTETDINVLEPAAPDIRIGRVFDRNWELLSPILPVWTIRNLVRRHFEQRISYLIYQNLSRLSSQWEESLHSALWAVEKESRRRLDELIGTVERLLETGDERAPQLRSDLARLQSALESFAVERG